MHPPIHLLICAQQGHGPRREGTGFVLLANRNTARQAQDPIRILTLLTSTTAARPIRRLPTSQTRQKKRSQKKRKVATRPLPPYPPQKQHIPCGVPPASLLPLAWTSSSPGRSSCTCRSCSCARPGGSRASGPASHRTLPSHPGKKKTTVEKHPKTSLTIAKKQPPLLAPPPPPKKTPKLPNAVRVRVRAKLFACYR